MPTTTKKGSKSTKEKPRRVVVKASPNKQAQAVTELRQELAESLQRENATASENVRLVKELQERSRDLTEALEQQTATGEVLRVIATSPTELQPVLDTLIANAVKLSGATKGHIRQYEGDSLVVVAHFGESAEEIERYHSMPVPVVPGRTGRRAMVEKKPVHVLDVQTEANVSQVARQTGERTRLVVPLLREDAAIGVITIWRDLVEPFTERQIELVKTFADQAVIAIENVRLFQELSESLERQTATSEILGVIASSPTDIQPVLNAVAENAAKLCDATDAIIWRVNGSELRRAAKHGAFSSGAIGEAWPLSRGRGWVPARAVLDRETIHIHDLLAEVETEFPESKRTQESTGARTVLVTPLLREGVSIGAIFIRRSEVRPFSEKQVALLKTFADQAVIAIENVRLFKELEARNCDLTEALEQQTATSEVLRVIAGSPTELQSVLDAVTESAVRLASATRGHIRQYDGEFLRLVASYGESPEQLAVFQAPVRPRAESRSGRAFLERRPIHDLDAQVERHPMAAQTGARTTLAVPLLREDTPIGVFTIWRDLVQPFTDRQIELVKTFADQAVIAIENVRLFQELQQRNRDLTEALEQQTATSEILAVIASSPTDIQPVLDTVIANAVTLAGAKHGHIRQLDGEFLRLVAQYNESPEYIAHLQANPVRVAQSLAGRAFLEGKPVQHLAGREEPGPTGWSGLEDRTLLAVPLLKKGTPIGNILIWRDVVEPFTERQIELVKTFADQAVIAIENVRLFQELEERNAELREALEHQTATAEVLGIISRSPTDVQPVLDAIVESAARVCGIDDVVLRLQDGDTWFRGLISVQSRFATSRSVLMRHRLLGSSSMARFMFPMSAEQNDVPTLGVIGDLADLFGRPPSSAGAAHWNAERASYRGSSLHPDSDQAAGNLRRPGGDCTSKTYGFSKN